MKDGHSCRDRQKRPRACPGGFNGFCAYSHSRIPCDTQTGRSVWLTMTTEGNIMTDEDRLIGLLRKHRELTAYIEKLAWAQTSVYRKRLTELIGEQQAVVNELIVLLDPHLRRLLTGWRNQLYKVE